MKVKLRELSSLDSRSKETEPDESFIQALLLRIRVEDELHASDSWTDCPRCGCQMWKSSALCQDCDFD